MQVKLEAELGRIPIMDVAPVVGCGRWPAKAVVGEAVEASAAVFREGHERSGAAVALRTPEGEELAPQRMSEVGVGLDRRSARVTPTANPDRPYTLTDHLDGTTCTRRRSNHVRLGPHTEPAHVCTFQENGGRARAGGGRGREANRNRRR